MAVTIDISQAGQLQSAIAKKLAEYAYSTEDDPVMAEYVTVMLANSKSSAQITNELSDLIGPEYDSGFTDWIFDSAIPEHYGAGASASAQGQETKATEGAAANASGPAAEESNSAAAEESREERARQTAASAPSAQQPSRGGNEQPFQRGPGGRNGPPTGPWGGSGVFGTAVAGLKREGDPGLQSLPRRPRLSEDGRRGGDGGPHSNGENTRSIFDRTGVRPGMNNNHRGGMHGNAAPFRPANGQGQGMAGNNMGILPGQSIQSGIPGLPPLHIPDNFNQLPPQQQQVIQQQIFQHQLIAAAAANQMFSAQTQQHLHQAAGAFGMPPQSPFQQQQFQQQQAAPAAPSPVPQAKPQKLPTKPASEELCKFGVNCGNAICKFSHPSPAATKESGLVLSKEVCEKGLECADKDCPKSHVSPAQKTDPQGLNVAQYLSKEQPAAAATPVPAPVAPQQAICAPNPGAKPCMYGMACTRPGCFFSHPAPAAAGPGSIPCKFGNACTRPDCHFSHPPGHRKPSAYQNYGSSNTGHKSATFSKATPGSPATPTSGTKPGSNGITNGDADELKKVDDSKMSARMKKFGANSGEGDKERVLPGSGLQAKDGKESEGEKKEDDLEVVM